MQTPENPQRRQLLKVLGGAGLSVSLGIQLTACKDKAENLTDEELLTFEPNAWITLYPDDKIEVAITKSEMGQGILTTFVLIVAEELNTDPNQISPVLVRPASKYGSMYTGGSSSVRSIWKPLREAAASFRLLLEQAAAKEWGVTTKQCKAHDGKVINNLNGQKKAFGSLCASARSLPLPDSAPLTKHDSMRFLGKPAPQSQILQKITGEARYGIDSAPESVAYAAVIHAPVFGTKLVEFSLSKALRESKSLLAVVELESAVAVISSSYWHATNTLRQAKVRWSQPHSPSVNMNSIREKTKTAIDTARNEAQSSSEREHNSGRNIESPMFENSYQAHVTMEPMNCTVHLNKDGCDIWIPTQDATHVLGTAGKALRSRLELLAYKALRKLGIDDDIRVHPTLAGGGFGRRLEVDYLLEALEIAKHVSRPVKVIWSREEDIQHDYYRPYSLHQLSAFVDDAGDIQRLRHIAAGADKGKITANINKLAYDIPGLELSFGEYDPGVPTGYWRSVAYSNHIFATESFIDLLAQEIGRSDFGIRQHLLRNDPRALRVLSEAQSVASSAQVKQQAHGLAFMSAYGSYIAMIVTLSGGSDTHRISGIYCTLDCGFALNPDNVKAQIEGGVIYGLNAAIKHSIHIADGKVSESNYDDYPLIRMPECPPIHIRIIESNEEPGGVGELSVPVVAPAIANALFNKTGQRPTTTPFTLDNYPADRVNQLGTLT